MGWAAGRGDPFLNLAAFLSLNKDGGWFGLLLIPSNNICSILPSKHFFPFTAVCSIIQEGKCLFRKSLASLATGRAIPTASSPYPYPGGENPSLSQVRPHFGGKLLTQCLG